MSELNDILKSSEGMLPEDKLLAYLEGRLPPEEQHEVEKWIAREGMEADALEGLNTIGVNESKQAMESLNLHLRKQLKTKKRRHTGVKGSAWSWLAVAIVLLIIVLAYIVIWLVLKNKM